MKLTRPEESVAMTASPMLLSVVRNDSRLRSASRSARALRVASAEMKSETAAKRAVWSKSSKSKANA
jgi:hypothetical protein